MNKKGFTLVELMIVIAIIGILASITVPAIFGKKLNTPNVQWGYNGVTEERCISGYKFIVGHDGRTVQMIGDNGAGVKCSLESPGQFTPLK